MWAQTPHGADSPAALDARKFQIPPGFKIELFAAEPMLSNPVAFSFNERGRAYVAETHRLNNSVFDITQNTNWLGADLALRTVQDRVDFMRQEFAANLAALTGQSERLSWMEDRDGDGTADHAGVFADGFNQIEAGLAAGVLARDGQVWFACIPDLRWFREASNSPTFSESGSLASGFGVHIGVTGHDLHGLAVGPEGKIYFSVGDRGMHIRHEGETLAYPDTGAVLRCRPDGSGLEVVAIGLRNPQELAFDDLGNLWTGDNDTAGPDDCRLLHIVEGADYGWRCSYQHMPGFGPWVLENLWRGGLDGVLPPAGLPAQGPSGLVFNIGVGLPAEYDGHFFICDFPGGVYSFPVAASGASYKMGDRKKILWNAWPTDVEFGPKPGLYFSDWVGGWGLPGKGRLYRLFDPALERDSAFAQSTQYLAEGMGLRAPNDLVALLGFKDRRVRAAAQSELARRGSSSVPILIQTALTSTARLPALHSLWALWQMSWTHSMGESALRLSELEPLLHSPDPEVRAQAARLFGEVPRPLAMLPLVELLRDADSRVRFFAAQSLGKLRSAAAATSLLAMVEANADADPFLTHAAVVALERVGENSALREARGHASQSVRRALLLLQRRAANPEITQWLEASEPALVTEAARAIYDVPIPKALPALAAMLGNPRLPAAAVSRAIQAARRVGGAPQAAALAKCAVQPDSSEQARAQAVRALGSWGFPEAIDPMVGLWRPMPALDPAAALASFQPVAETLLRDPSEAVASAAIEAAGRLRSEGVAGHLLAFVNDPSRPPQPRARALQTLATLRSGGLDEPLAAALKSGERALVLGGLALVSHPASPSLWPLVAPFAERRDDWKLAQAALRASAEFETPEAGEFLAMELERLKAGQLPPQLLLDVVMAAEKSQLPKPRELAADLSAAEAGLAKLCLEGGDKAAGERIFFDRADVSCLRCHQVKNQGGIVGPNLGSIASIRSRSHLLESILNPNAEIAPGFENALLTLANGRTHAGVVRSETDNEIVLDSPEDGLLTLSKTEVTRRQRTLSAMPEGLGKMLTPFELRDLVEFLSSLR